MTARKPCFNCYQSEQDDMNYGECYESPLCTDMGGPCWHMNNGGHWEDCPWGCFANGYPAWAERLSTVKCPCCKGSGSIPKEGSIVDEICGLEWVYWGSKPMCPLCCRLKHEGHEPDCKIVAILRRLNGKT